jgi:hypothetical protein
LKNNKTFFEAEITSTYGPSSKIKDEILKRYPTPGPGSKFKDEKERFINYMQFQFFTCHVRTITNAYKDKSWVAQYSRGLGKHGMDMQADFYNKSGSPPKDDPGFATFAPAYQDLLLSHARTGDPNTLGKKGTGIEWPKVTVGKTFGNVLEAGKQGFNLIEDQLTKAGDCDVFTDILAGVTKSGGELSHYTLGRYGFLETLLTMVQGIRLPVEMCQQPLREGRKTVLFSILRLFRHN